MPQRVFVLSPASCSGERAGILLREGARFELALRVQSELGAPLGEVFAFLSGLYFRGKLTYARRFAPGTPERPGALVITPRDGLLAPEAMVRASDLRGFAEVRIDASNPSFRRPFIRDALWRSASLPMPRSFCSAASRREGTSTAFWRSSVRGCCFLGTSSAAVT